MDPVHPLNGAPAHTHIASAEAEIIDRALMLAYSQLHRFAGRLSSEAIPPPSLARLRAGPLGCDLRRLAALARGDETAPQDQVLVAVESVVQLLFWPAGAADYAVPRSFWETDLGMILARAKFRAFAPAELLGISAAASSLGVARPTIYRWVDGGVLDSVRDDVSGRTFVVGRDVAYMQAMPPA